VGCLTVRQPQTPAGLPAGRGLLVNRFRATAITEDITVDGEERLQSSPRVKMPTS
jgi:hypothetical protein